MMKKGLGIGAGIGVALMYFLDPKSGNRRRSVMAHKMAWLGKHIGKGVAWPIMLIR
jgi:hypothetical protein